MARRKLPEIVAARPAGVTGFEIRPQAFDRWDSSLRPSARADDNAATITILDVIGESWDGAGVTDRRISAALREIGDRDVVVEINSPGGDFFQGVSIYNMLRAHPREVTVRVLGVAASAASVVAMAGDRIEIGKAGFLMIHNTWSVAIGNRHDLRAFADTLEPFDAAMATVYAERAGVDYKIAARWMDDETWFNGDDAVTNGLADGYLPADAVTHADQETAKATIADRRVEAALAAQNMPRAERRALIGVMKKGAAVAPPDRPAVAGAEWLAQAQALTNLFRG